VTRRRPNRRAGFTLVELLVAVSLAGIVMTGTLTTYLFLGRNLARLQNQQVLDEEHRRLLLEFSQDFRMAEAVTAASDTAVTFRVPTATGTFTVTYTYTAGASFTGTLVRTTTPATRTRTLANSLGSFDFDYFDGADNAVTVFPNKLTSVRKVAFDYTAQTGYARTGTRTPVQTVASARLVLRNARFLE
jgi:prepilin-type N-terminal cleavage/methylation domain-containing protein